MAVADKVCRGCWNLFADAGDRCPRCMELADLRAEKERLTEALANLNDRYIHVSDLHIDKNARIAELEQELTRLRAEVKK